MNSIGVIPDLVEESEITANHQISRRQFKGMERWSWNRLLEYEKLAILCVPWYASTIFERDKTGIVICDSHGHAIKKPLTDYHRWVLKKIRSLFSRGLREEHVEIILDRDVQNYAFESYLKETHAKNEILRQRQQQRYQEQQRQRQRQPRL